MLKLDRVMVRIKFIEQQFYNQQVVLLKAKMFKVNLSDSNTLTGPRSPDQQSFLRFQQSKLYSLKESYLSFPTDPSQHFQQTLNPHKATFNIPENILGVIQKKAEDRTSVQNSILIKYLLKFRIFKELSERLSIDVVKHMIKQGTLKLYNEGDLLTSHDKLMKKVRILLSGEVGSLLQDGQSQTRQGVWQILDRVVQKVGRQAKKFKANPKTFSQSQSKSIIMRRQTIRQFNQVQLKQKIEPNTILNYLPLILDQPKHTETLIVTKNESLVFVIGINQFYEALFLFYNAKISQVIKTFKKTPIFNAFQNSKLKFLVQRLQLLEIKKNEFVFKQGDSSECFYLLTQGQIQVSKTIEILAQNPNNLYRSRAQLSKEHQNKNITTLPYANFNGVYHYEPEQKRIVLATINPICVFGQEQVTQNKVREVTAKVTSLTAKMYKILLSDIQEFCLKLSDSAVDRKLNLLNFFSLVQESITLKKVLFRQSHLAEMVSHENKTKYQSLFKDKAKKKHSKSVYTQNRKTTIQQPAVKQNMFEQVPPTYNHLNFTDFQKQNQEFQTMPSTSFTSDEVKIAKLTHVNLSNQVLKESQGKANNKQIRIRNKSNQGIFNKKRTMDSSLPFQSLDISPFKTMQRRQEKRLPPRISLEDPLFTVNYFRKQQQFEKKLVFVAKKKKLQQIYRSSF